MGHISHESGGYYGIADQRIRSNSTTRDWERTHWIQKWLEPWANSAFYLRFCRGKSVQCCLSQVLPNWRTDHGYGHAGAYGNHQPAGAGPDDQQWGSDEPSIGFKALSKQENRGFFERAEAGRGTEHRNSHNSPCDGSEWLRIAIVWNRWR